MSKIKFVLNDERKVNQKGFRILNAGIDLERFKANPVILDSHWNSNQSVIGKWENIRIEGYELVAEPVFDRKSEIGNRIAEQVEDGFVRGCSLGIDPLSSENFVLDENGIWVLTKGEVFEASIVAIPNNANALVKLYASQQLMSDDESNDLLNQLKINSKMNKILLKATAAFAALGYQTAQELTPEQIETGILKLEAERKKAVQERDEYKTKFEQLKTAQDNEKIRLAHEAVEADIKAGKIAATEKEQYQELAIAQPEIYKSMMAKIPAKGSLGGKVQTLGAEVPQSLDDFQKLSFSDQVAFKENFPEEYKKLTSVN